MKFARSLVTALVKRISSLACGTLWGGWRIVLLIVALLPAAVTLAVERHPSYSRAKTLREDATLRAVAFANQQVGLAVGDRGTILLTNDGGRQWKVQESGVDCQLLDVVWLNERHAVAVGGGHDPITGISRGVVIASVDGGKRWQRGEDGDLPRLTRIGRAAETGRLIAAGDWSPSERTRGFESRDGGKHWQSRRLPEPLASALVQPSASTYRQWTEHCQAPAPIRGRCRVGSAELWAVGDHGLIMHSGDRGQSWQTRRGTQRRTAVLVIADEAASVPWPLIGNEALEFGNRVALLVLEPSGPEDLSIASDHAAVQQTAIMLGAAGADVASRVRDTQHQAVKDWLAMHRPSVVVVDRDLPDATRAVIRKFAVDNGVSRLISSGLSGHGESRIHVNAMFPRTGVLARDLWQDALQRVAPYRSPASGISLWWEYDSVGTPARGESVASGVGLTPGQQLTAELPPASRRQLQIAQARLNQDAQLKRLFDTGKTRDAFATAFKSLLAQHALEDRFRFAWSTLLKARRDGTLRQESQILETIAEIAPPASVRGWADLRLQALQGSEETRRLRSMKLETLRQYEDPRISRGEAIHVSPFQVESQMTSAPAAQGSGEVARVAANSPVMVPDAQPIPVSAANVDAMRRNAIQRAEEAVDLAWEFHPLVLIARDAQRRRGDEGGLQPTEGPSAALRRLAQERNGGTWPRLLESPYHRPVKAPRTATPPRLDNNFDDDCWQYATPVSSSGQAGESEIQYRLAYDEDYVYLAIECPAEMVRVDSSEPGDAQRRRDSELSAADRVRIQIDTDRDLLTSCCLEVTSSGRTRDSIEGDTDWQPSWYVAANAEGETTSFEIAFSRRDLCDLPIRSGTSWYVSIDLLRQHEAGQQSAMPVAGDWFRVVFE